MQTYVKMLEAVSAAGGASVMAQSALRFMAFARDEIARLPDCPLRAAYQGQLEEMERLFPAGPRRLP